MAIQVEPGGEYCGETYIYCPGHELSVKPYRNNGTGHGAIFNGESRAELVAFLTEHAECP
jgi:hypothetical protein